MFALDGICVALSLTVKAGDTFKQFRKPAGIPSFGAAISEDGDEEDATPSQPAAAIASAAALPKPRFGQPLDQLPDQRFTQKSTLIFLAHRSL